MADEPLGKEEIFQVLRDLGDLEQPVWLAGGLAADFHVGRWTRDHDDIDLVAFKDDREALAQALSARGFTKTDDDGWITRWTRRGRDIGEVSLAFMRRAADDTGHLVILPEGTRGGQIVPGVYPGVDGNLDVHRVRTLEGIAFRVVSAEDEWVFTKSFPISHPGAEPGPTDVHNVALLESVLTQEDLERLRPLVGRRYELEDADAQS